MTKRMQMTKNFTSISTSSSFDVRLEFADDKAEREEKSERREKPEEPKDSRGDLTSLSLDKQGTCEDYSD
jgi:hypothetical protein